MLYTFSKSKADMMKTILPFTIILHHLSHITGGGILMLFDSIDQYVLSIFFAMSGYGLVFSYQNRPNYLIGFLEKSFLKLYIPYVICLVYFQIYRSFVGINTFEVITDKGICGLVPASWFIFVLSLFYLFFYLIFKYGKMSIKYKILCVSLLVIAYYFIAKYFGVSYWRYLRTPAFCVGLFMGYFHNSIIEKLNIKTSIGISFIFLYLATKSVTLLPITFSLAFFFFIFSFPSVKKVPIVNIIGGLSLEMYIVQYIPIYIFVNDIKIDSIYLLIICVIALDIVLAIMTKKVAGLLVYKCFNRNGNSNIKKA